MTLPIITQTIRKRRRNDKLRVNAFGLIWKLSDDLPPEERLIKAICATADDVPINRKALADYYRLKHNEKLFNQAWDGALIENKQRLESAGII